MVHADKTVEVTVEADTFQVTVEPGITITAPAPPAGDIRQHKASNYQRANLLRARQSRD